MIAGLVARGRSLWRALRARGELEARMREEFRLHLELRAEDLVRGGLAPAQAARQAREEFGSPERYRDEARASRGLRPFDDLRISWLDVKLGTRMLVKHPGITLIGGLAMALAIWVGAGTFELVTQVLRPTLPLPEGERIVALRNWDAAAGRAEPHVLHDLAAWRGGLRSVGDVGAYRTVERNLTGADGSAEPVTVAEMSASGFRLARVPALAGRPLLDADERPGAPAVVVIGHGVWQTRFASDPAIVGRSVRLGATEHTVVGVMPAGFAFPVAHNLWVPFRADPLAHARRQGPEIQLFGRLAPGATLGEAQAELTTLGTRAAAEFRDTHERLRPQVLPYARSVVDVSGLHALALASANVPVVLLLVLVFANVALLMFARAATRESEIVVRSALGASRGRITMQLFAEALVLGGLAAVAGLAAAGAGLRWVMRIVEGEILRGGKLPFWFDDRLSPATLLYAAALTLLGAVIAGVVPALKVTRGLATRLKQATAGGGGLQFGGLWTAVIVAQVAVTVAFPVTAYVTRLDAVQIRSLDVGFEDAQYLSVRLEMDREPGPGAGADTSRAAFEARFRRTYAELERRLLADPAVLGVTFADRLPRMYHPHRLVEVDDGGAAPLDPRWPAYRVSSASVDRDFFDVLGTPIRAGRGFHAADLAADARAVIVNQSFVDNVLGERNPIGRRVRYVAKEEAEPRKLKEPSAWYEIVGVVQDLGLSADRDPKVAGFYHPVAEGGAYPAQLAVHVAGRANAFVPRMRAVAAATDPTLRLYALTPIAAINEAELEFLAFWFRILLGVSAVAMTLSLAGIYAVMSFTVARRTREIGIRVALGANRRRVVAAVFRRPLAQVATGIVAGGSLLAVTVLVGDGGALSPRVVLTIVGYSALMMGVCMLACIVPTRRALRVEPTEALRADG